MIKNLAFSVTFALALISGSIVNAQQYEQVVTVVDMQCQQFDRNGETWSTCVFWMSDGSMYSTTGRVYWV